PYRSQQIVYSLQLYGELLNLTCKRFDLPKFDKFIVEDLGQERRYQTVKNGRRFSVVEIRKSLFPLEAGTFTLPATELTCNVTYPSTGGARSSPFDRLFSRGRTETKILRTEEITLQVKALPPAPADFSNIVGRVMVGASMDTRVIPAGSSVTQTLYVKSSGALRGLVPPAPTLANVKIYDDQPKLSFNDRGPELETVMRMNRAFVPTEPGTLEVPGFSVGYFDPDEGAYKRAVAPPTKLRVTPGAQGQDTKLVDGQGPAKSAPAPAPTVVPSGTVLAPMVSSAHLAVTAPPIWLVLLVGLLPPLLLVSRRLRHIRLPARSGSKRGPLRRILAPLEGGSGDADVVDKVIREVLARGGLENAGSGEIQSALEEQGVPPADRDAADRWLRWIESSRWGAHQGAPPGPASELGALLGRIDQRLGA
ncbi:MAG: hypothetical protein AAFX94_01515, partial [Myxococcota bacterium]